MQETFQRYPELFLYYGGCTYLSVPEGLELEVQYQNTPGSPGGDPGGGQR